MRHVVHASWTDNFTVLHCASAFVMATLGSRCAIQMRTLHFCPVVSIFLPFSSPNLGRRRLDVYHTSIHDVALVRI